MIRDGGTIVDVFVGNPLDFEQVEVFVTSYAIVVVAFISNCSELNCIIVYPVQAFVPRNYLLSCQMVLINVGLTDSINQPQCSCRCSVTSWICWSWTMVSVPCM